MHIEEVLSRTVTVQHCAADKEEEEKVCQKKKKELQQYGCETCSCLHMFKKKIIRKP